MDDDLTRDGPYVVVQRDGWYVRLLVGLDDKDVPCDVDVVLNDGGRYTGVFATISQLENLMRAWGTTGECLAGKYLWIKSLVIVENLSPGMVADVVADMILSNEVHAALTSVNVEEFDSD